ncbi:MAG: GNAT family N-acetyltransferase [Pseudomonadota bacterium]
METTTTIRNGIASDVEPLVATLCDSFRQDPMLNWVIPSAELYPDYFRLLLHDVYLPRGIIHMESGGRATALWLPPEQRLQIPPRLALLRLALALLRRKGVRPLWRINRQGQVFSRHLPTEPHYYLQFIGCRQDDQGQGIGSALLAAGTRVCDEHGMPAYLESSNVRNVPLYERHGFVVKGEEAVSKGGPTAWFMWRDPN